MAHPSGRLSDRVGLGPHAVAAVRFVRRLLGGGRGAPQAEAACRGRARGLVTGRAGDTERLCRRALPARAFFFAAQRGSVLVQSAVAEATGDGPAEVEARRARRRGAMANPAPRRFGLRRSTVRAAPAGHGSIVAAISVARQGSRGAGRQSNGDASARRSGAPRPRRRPAIRSSLWPTSPSPDRLRSRSPARLPARHLRQPRKWPLARWQCRWRRSSARARPAGQGPGS